jgi:N-acyl-D-aspartate/D-glutamate deacylase
VLDYISRRDAPQNMERITRLARGKKIRIQFTGGIPTWSYQAPLVAEAKAMHEARKAEGVDAWVAYSFSTFTIMVGFINTLSWAQQNNYVWHEIVEAKTEDEKLALLASPEWRARARASWDAINPVSRAKDPDTFILFDSESGAGPIGITLKQFQEQQGYAHPSDALADWVLENGVQSNLKMRDIPNNEEVLDYLFHDPMTIGNLSDAGAHSKMMAGVGDNVMFLTKYARDTKRVSIEQAIHILTGKIAGHFGFIDRGVLEVGKRADIVVFDLAEIAQRPEFKMYDVPDGEGGRTYRYSRLPAPMRLTMCNGVATFHSGSFTGNFPGQHITGEVPPPAYAQAAE